VERGNHAELRWAGGLYQRLYEMQHRVESDAFVNPGEEFPDPDALDEEEPPGRVRLTDPRRL
jgi:hypothetical protein